VATGYMDGINFCRKIFDEYLIIYSTLAKKSKN